MPSLPKSAATRQRKNRSSTAATLPAERSMEDATIPDLPGRTESEGGWHPLVVQWWRDVWRSPMAAEYVTADIHGLYRLAFLLNDFWTASSVTGRIEASKEIRLVGQTFGLSPIDRRRLQWEIDKGEEAEERAQKRRTGIKQPTPGKDPRQLLKVVNS